MTYIVQGSKPQSQDCIHGYCSEVASGESRAAEMTDTGCLTDVFIVRHHDSLMQYQYDISDHKTNSSKWWCFLIEQYRLELWQQKHKRTAAL